MDGISIAVLILIGIFQQFSLQLLSKLLQSPQKMAQAAQIRIFYRFFACNTVQYIKYMIK